MRNVRGGITSDFSDITEYENIMSNVCPKIQQFKWNLSIP